MVVFWDMLYVVLVCLCGECMVCAAMWRSWFLVVVVESVCDLYCGDEMYFVFMKSVLLELIFCACIFL